MFWDHFKNSKKYFYIIIEDIEFYDDRFKSLDFSNDYCEFKNGKLTVKKGYAFNGATPRWEFFGCEFGTPQGRAYSGLRGFAFHDAMYQYGKVIGLKRKYADRVQKTIHIEDEFNPAKFYCVVLRVFGWLAYSTQK